MSFAINTTFTNDLTFVSLQSCPMRSKQGNVQLVHYLEIFGVHSESFIQSCAHRISIKHNGSRTAEILQSCLEMDPVLGWRQMIKQWVLERGGGSDVVFLHLGLSSDWKSFSEPFLNDLWEDQLIALLFYKRNTNTLQMVKHSHLRDV